MTDSFELPEWASSLWEEVPGAFVDASVARNDLTSEPDREVDASAVPSIRLPRAPEWRTSVSVMDRVYQDITVVAEVRDAEDFDDPPASQVGRDVIYAAVDTARSLFEEEMERRFADLSSAEEAVYQRFLELDFADPERGWLISATPTGRIVPIRRRYRVNVTWRVHAFDAVLEGKSPGSLRDDEVLGKIRDTIWVLAGTEDGAAAIGLLEAVKRRPSPGDGYMPPVVTHVHTYPEALPVPDEAVERLEVVEGAALAYCQVFTNWAEQARKARNAVLRAKEDSIRLKDVQDRWTVVYRLYDAHDRLLYVGVSGQGDPATRLQDHLAKPWAKEVMRRELAYYPSRQEALNAELRAIRLERPIHNIAGRLD